MINYELNYKIIGNGEEILFIPGWNDNLKHFIPLANKIKELLASNYIVYDFAPTSVFNSIGTQPPWEEE